MLFFVASLVAVCLLTLVVSSMINSDQTDKNQLTDSTNTTVEDSVKPQQRKRKDTVVKQFPVQKKAVPAKTKDGLINDVPEF